MSVVLNITHEGLVNRRDSILSDLNSTSEEFEATKSNRSLTGDEWEAKENLDAIEFLLGEDPTD